MRSIFKAGLAFCLIVLILLGLRHAGPALVVNQPQPSDVILLLAGDVNDARYWKGIELLRAGYAPRMWWTPPWTRSATGARRPS